MFYSKSKRKVIHISCLLKDNKIVAYYIGPNAKEKPSDYYKDFIYANVSMENCDKEYDVKYMSVEYGEDDNLGLINSYIFDEVAKTFFKHWKIHPRHWGQPAY